MTNPRHRPKKKLKVIDGVECKQCTVCKKDVPLSEYYFTPSTGYYHSQCNTCRKQSAKVSSRRQRDRKRAAKAAFVPKPDNDFRSAKRYEDELVDKMNEGKCLSCSISNQNHMYLTGEPLNRVDLHDCSILLCNTCNIVHEGADGIEDKVEAMSDKFRKAKSDVV